jgi:hypothetical protein
MNLSRFASPRILMPALALAAGLATALPAAGATCVQGYAQCLVDASDLDTWWQRTAAGIDCYLDAVSCLKGAYG